MEIGAVSVDYSPLKTLSLSLSVTEVAISPSNNEVHIYAKKGSKWEVEHVLSEHGQRVTGMDWAKKSDRLVTCGAVSPFHSFTVIVKYFLYHCRTGMPMCGRMEVESGNHLL